MKGIDIIKKINYKAVLVWVLAVVITIVAAVYQKKTGPTYPKEITTEFNGQKYKLAFLRSHGGVDNAQIDLRIADKNVGAIVYYKNYPESIKDDWMKNDFERLSDKNGNFLRAELPHQQPAGKLMYYIVLKTDTDQQTLFKQNPIVIRFKGDVPMFVLIPHIIFIFFAMMFANVAGLLAAFKMPKYKLFTIITLVGIFIGGLILGPIVQKYAFNEFWAGVPFGWDLTDNKLLIAFIFWLLAYAGNRKSEKAYLTIIAAIVTLIVFSIPHSMFGSELNRETGNVTQGFINFIKPLFY